MSIEYKLFSEHVVAKINAKVEAYLRSSSSWWEIHPSLKFSVNQYQDRLAEANKILYETKLMYALLPEGDVKQFGVVLTLKELRDRLVVDLDRAGAKLSPYQKDPKTKRVPEEW